MCRDEQERVECRDEQGRVGCVGMSRGEWGV